MKIFWSWQSDSPDNTGRHFVREALDAALEQLKNEASIEESLRDLDYDHDRTRAQGGSSLAKITLEKIDHTNLFVADVTPVGKTAIPGKKMNPIINSNVAIELGYALARLGGQRLLMVLNKAYGTHEDLPYSLRNKSGLITYFLSTGATAEDKKHKKKQLTSVLKTAIRERLDGQIDANETPHIKKVAHHKEKAI
jgi:hypothetical protein